MKKALIGFGLLLLFTLDRSVAEKLRSFRHIADFHGKKVYFYKPAQLCAADLHGAFGGMGWGSFRDMGELTAFADYKLPQVLRHAGVLIYEADLASKVDQGIHLDPGSPEEVEIRSNTIWSVDLIREEMKQRGKGFRSFEIDRLLWTLGQSDEFRQSRITGRQPYSIKKAEYRRQESGSRRRTD